MKYSQFEMQIDKDQLLQPLTEIAQQNIKGGQAGEDDDDIPDKIILDVAEGTVERKYKYKAYLTFDGVDGESND